MAPRGSTREQLTQLAEIARCLIEGSLEERLTAVVERAPKALGLKSASIFLVRTDFPGFGGRLAVSGVELIDAAPRPEGLTAQVIHTRQVLAVEDTRGHPEVHPSVIQAGIRSFLAVPLKSSAGCHGVLYLNQSRPQSFAEADLRLAEAIGDMVGQAVENARLQESEREARQALETERRHLASLTAALHRSLAEADLLRTIDVAAASADDLATLLDVTIRHLGSSLPLSGGSILLAAGEQLLVGASSGQTRRSSGQRLRRSQQPIWHVLDVGEPRIDGARQLVVPLRRRGQVFGLLELASEQAFEVPALNLARKVADEIAGWAYILARG